jgi:hypothetical protein
MLLQPDGRFVSTTAKASPLARRLRVLRAETRRGRRIVYGHNIRRHDLPMLNAGLIRRSCRRCAAADDRHVP